MWEDAPQKGVHMMRSYGMGRLYLREKRGGYSILKLAKSIESHLIRKRIRRETVIEKRVGESR